MHTLDNLVKTNLQTVVSKEPTPVLAGSPRDKFILPTLMASNQQAPLPFLQPPLDHDFSPITNLSTTTVPVPLENLAPLSRSINQRYSY